MHLQNHTNVKGAESRRHQRHERSGQMVCRCIDRKDLGRFTFLQTWQLTLSKRPVLSVKYKLTIDEHHRHVHVFPTITESIKLAATSFRKDIDQLSCCAE